MDIGLIETERDFEELRPGWTALYQRVTGPNPFLSFEWTSACRAHICPDASLFVITARLGEELVGVAPFCLERRAGFRVARFIGDGRSDYLGFLTDPAHPGVEEALLNGLAALRGRWDLALLRQLADSHTGLDRALVPDGLRSRGIEGTVAPYLSFPGDFAALCADGPSSVRRGKRAARKFEKDGGTVTRCAGSEAAGRVEEIAGVELRSWKGRDRVARFQPGPGERLLRQALETLAARGEMEVWVARIEGKAIAFQINFLTAERLWYYQGAYDEEYRKLYPGGVLHYRCMERAWQAGLREYDFMSGDEPYKAGWTNGVRSLRYRALFPASALGYAAYAALLAPRWSLKGSKTARAAYQWWVRARSHPAAALGLPFLRGEPAAPAQG